MNSEILNELMEIAPKLALLEKTNPYKAPDGYFVNFKNELFEKLKQHEVKSELNLLAPEISKFGVNFNNNVPVEYFNNFSARLINKIRADETLAELAKIAPELSKLDKANIFEVSAAYFTAFPERVLNKARQAQPAPVPDAPKWVQQLNDLLEQATSRIFKPKYTFAFAGIATSLIIAVMFFMKINTCNDLDCKFAQLSNEEINNYLDNKSDAYSDEIFEMNLDGKTIPTINKDGTIGIYKDALKDVDDAALNEAISD